MGQRRKRWTVEDKRRIVALTLEPGASVARVAQAEGVNANQLFCWRRGFLKEQSETPTPSLLLPVVLEGGTACDAVVELEATAPTPLMEVPAVEHTGAIHIELPGRAMISVERGADRALLRTLLECLAK